LWKKVRKNNSASVWNQVNQQIFFSMALLLGPNPQFSCLSPEKPNSPSLCLSNSLDHTLAARNIHRITKNIDGPGNPKILSTIFKLRKIELFAGKKKSNPKNTTQID
jgi:hypothetical protein